MEKHTRIRILRRFIELNKIKEMKNGSIILKKKILSMKNRTIEEKYILIVKKMTFIFQMDSVNNINMLHKKLSIRKITFFQNNIQVR